MYILKFSFPFMVMMWKKMTLKSFLVKFCRGRKSPFSKCLRDAVLNYVVLYTNKINLNMKEVFENM